MNELRKAAPIPTPVEKGTFDEVVDGETNTYYYMTMDFLGQSLASVAKEIFEEHFSERTVINLTLQIINLLRCVHQQGFIHRDLKPDNFLIGCTTPTKPFVYMIDFGMAERYIEGGSHREDSQ